MQDLKQLKRSALDAVTAPSMVVEELPLAKLKPNPYQKRKRYGDIESLADSISTRGLQNPISVIRIDETLIIVSGHRRVAAFRYLRRKSIPGIIRKESTWDDLAIDIAVENLQRKDLTPLEVGETLLQMLYTIPSVQKSPSRVLTLINQIKLYNRREVIGTDFTGELGFQDADLFKAMKFLKLVGISANTATSYIRILQLPEEICEKVVSTNKLTNSVPDGMLTVKTAYELTRVTDPELQRDLCNKIVDEKLKYVDVKYMVDSVIESGGAVANRNMGMGTAARRVDDDGGAAELTEKLHDLSSTVWNFRAKLPLVCRRLDKVLWVAALNRMKRSCLEMVHAINNLLREDLRLEDWLELVNADLEVQLTPPGKPGEKLRFSFPREKAELLELAPGDKLLIRIEGVVKYSVPQPAYQGADIMDRIEDGSVLPAAGDMTEPDHHLDVHGGLD